MSSRMKYKQIMREVRKAAGVPSPKKRLTKRAKGVPMQWRPLAKRKFQMKRKGKRVSRVE